MCLRTAAFVTRCLLLIAARPCDPNSMGSIAMQLWADLMSAVVVCPAEAQDFKKGFEAAAESNAKLISSPATVGGDGTAEAADQLADELGKAKVEGEEAPAAAEPAAKEGAKAEA